MYEFTQEFPGGGYANNPNVLRIDITAARCLRQNLNPKLANHIEVGEADAHWSMIAPTDIQENISHTWEEYSSIQGRVAQARTDIIKSGTKIFDLRNGGRQGGGTGAALNKVDSPMVYTGSERREYSFTFLLQMYTDIGSKEVAQPINEFRKYSCATIDNISADTIEFPHIFTIESMPQPFIYVKWCVLTNVQVTYNAPYRNGYPQRAELTLTFKDIRPLYKNSWLKDVGGHVTTGQIARVRRMRDE